MLVPRSFKYSSSPPKDPLDEKSGRRNVRTSTPPKASEARPLVRPAEPLRTATEPVHVPTKPVSVPVPATPLRTRSDGPVSMPSSKSRAPSSGKRKAQAHNPNALPPAVAALLAVTTIPRPKPSQFRRKASSPRHFSIDELVNEWKNDESLNSSLSTSPALSALLEDVNDEEERRNLPVLDSVDNSFLHTRSVSAESVPSLEEDERSILSTESLPTPESLRSRKSSSNLKKEKARSLPTSQDCALDHPLSPPPLAHEDEDDGLPLPPPNTSRQATPPPKATFKSNLTTSLQALKTAALNSISSLTNPTLTTTPTTSAATIKERSPSWPLSDDTLWSHPFLFPRFSPEIRPALTGTPPSQAERRYLNPTPLTFEELEAPYQRALHAPFLAEKRDEAPLIQMQTYSRGRRKAAARQARGAPDPGSEAGRALAGGVRQREPRENGDFLRVVVLEMNMKRAGKLEVGRAKIWLPPRCESVGGSGGADDGRRGRVPERWVGVSAC